MLRSGRFAAAAASLLLAGAFFAVTPSDARAATAAAGCQDAELAMLAAPIAPWKGAPLRVLVAADQALDGEFTLIAPDGSVAAKSHDRYGGPPYFWIAEVAAPAVGTWHGSRNCSTRRSIPNRRGKPGTKCCAINRATFCSTISAPAKTT